MTEQPKTIRRTYRMRVYPTAAQQEQLAPWFGAACWVWNHSLERRSKAYRCRGESVSGVDVSRALTKLKRTRRYGWLAEVPSALLQQKLRDQDCAFANFFAGRTEYPKFRKRGHSEAVRLTLDHRHRGRIRRWESGEVDVPELGVLAYRGRWHPGQAPKMVTVRRDSAGRHFVTASVEEAAQTAPATTRIVGIDLGLKGIAVLSTGEKVDNPRPSRCARRRSNAPSAGFHAKGKALSAARAAPVCRPASCTGARYSQRPPAQALPAVSGREPGPCRVEPQYLRACPLAASRFGTRRRLG